MKQSRGIILIVDDNEQFISIIRPPLVYCGFQVFAATDVGRAIDFTKELRPDLIILDLKMPGTNGVEFLKRYRSAERNVPIILLTGYMNQFKDQITPEMNVFGYLNKRFHKKELEQLVYDALKRPESERIFSETAKARLMIVDDEVDITDMVKDFFSERNFVVATANSASEALKKNQHFQTDILVSDIKMPRETDGIQLVQEILKTEKPPCGIFFISGVGNSQLILDQMKVAFGEVPRIISKPLSFEIMEKLLAECEGLIRNSKPKQDEKK